MERTSRAGCFVLLIEGRGLLPRLGIDHGNRVQRRTALVVCFDAGEVLTHQRRAGELPRLECRVNAGDGCLVELEGWASLRLRDEQRGGEQ